MNNHDEVAGVLRSAGWHAGRRMDLTDWATQLDADGFGPMHAAATRFLGEYGALYVDGGGSGAARIRDPFELDPLLCLGESDRFLAYSRRVGRPIYPLGELDQRYFLGLDETAELYFVGEWLGSYGPLPLGFDNLVLGNEPYRLDT